MTGPGEDMAARVRVPKAAVLVARAVREQIVRGELPEGGTLPTESELSEQFGISRPTVREALRILEAEGLISIGRGARSGARVHLPGRETAARQTGLLLQVQGTTLADIYEARVDLFAPAARRLARRVTKTDLRALRRSLQELRDLVDRPGELVAAAARFNMTLLELAGNRTTAVLAGMLTDIVELHQQSVARDRQVRPVRGQGAEAVCDAVAHLIGLIESGDGEAAEAYWREQMHRAAVHTLERAGARTVVDLLGS